MTDDCGGQEPWARKFSKVIACNCALFFPFSWCSSHPHQQTWRISKHFFFFNHHRQDDDDDEGEEVKHKHMREERS